MFTAPYGPCLYVCYSLMLVFTELIPAAILSGTSKRAAHQFALLFSVYSAGQEFVHFCGNRRVIAVQSGSCSDYGDDNNNNNNNNKRSNLECVKRRSDIFPLQCRFRHTIKLTATNALTSQQLGSGFIYAYACSKVESYCPAPT